MKSADLRKLIGKEVTWVDTFCPKRGGIRRYGLLLDVRGKNALIDDLGSNDWKWVPDMVGLRQKSE